MKEFITGRFKIYLKNKLSLTSKGNFVLIPLSNSKRPHVFLESRDPQCKCNVQTSIDQIRRNIRVLRSLSPHKFIFFSKQAEKTSRVRRRRRRQEWLHCAPRSSFVSPNPIFPLSCSGRETRYSRLPLHSEQRQMHGTVRNIVFYSVVNDVTLCLCFIRRRESTQH